MYEHEEVEEKEGKELAKELGAIFQKTSAKESTGVDDLFVKIGKKFLNPNSTESTNTGKADAAPRGQKLTGDKEGKDGLPCHSAFFERFTETVYGLRRTEENDRPVPPYQVLLHRRRRDYGKGIQSLQKSRRR